jgi:hypothetical protein
VWNTRNCCGREAPAVCNRDIVGRLLVSAIFAIRDPLRTEKALEAPPSIVGIDEVIIHFTPLLLVGSGKGGKRDT